MLLGRSAQSPVSQVVLVDLSADDHTSSPNRGRWPRSVSVTGCLYRDHMSNFTNPPTPPPPEGPPLDDLRPIDRAARRVLVRDLPDDLRQLRRAVMSETMANGLPVRPAALCAVLAAHNDLAESPLCFTTDHVQELMWCGVQEYCDDIGFLVPEGCPQALHAILAVATAHELFDDDSDPVGDVFGALGELVAS